MNREVLEDLQVPVNVRGRDPGDTPPAAKPGVQVGERAKDDVGGGEVLGRPQVKGHQKEPLSALGRKAVLRVRIDLPQPLQGTSGPVDDR